jgi:hypothetical protein
MYWKILFTAGAEDAEKKAIFYKKGTKDLFELAQASRLKPVSTAGAEDKSIK